MPPKAKRAPTWTEFTKGFEYPDYGEDTRILDLIMKQRRPEADSDADADLSRFPELGGQEEEASPEPPIYDPLGYRDIPRPLRGQDIRTPMGKPDELDLGVLGTERLKEDPALYAMIAKSGAQMGTLGGKAADTSAVTGYADLLGKRKIRSEDRRDKQKMALAKYLAGLKAQKQQSRENERDRLLKRYLGMHGPRSSGSSIENVYAKMLMGKQLTEQFQIKKGKREAKEKEIKGGRLYNIPGVGIGKDKATFKQLVEMNSLRNKIIKKSERLIEIDDAHGYIIPGTKASIRYEADRLATDLGLEYKEYKALGALTAPDLPFLHKNVPQDPTGFDLGRAVGDKSKVQVKLRSWMDEMDEHFLESVRIGSRAGSVSPGLIQRIGNRQKEYHKFQDSYDPEGGKKRKQKRETERYPDEMPRTKTYKYLPGEAYVRYDRENGVIGYFAEDGSQLREEKMPVQPDDTYGGRFE